MAVGLPDVLVLSSQRYTGFSGAVDDTTAGKPDRHCPKVQKRIVDGRVAALLSPSASSTQIDLSSKEEIRETYKKMANGFAMSHSIWW